MFALERTPKGVITYFGADYEPADKSEALFARLRRPDGSVEVLALRPPRDDFHLPGQHDQQSHAGDDAGSDWRHKEIDVTTLNNTKHTPAAVRQLESPFYNAEPETVDEMFGWHYLEQLQSEQRAFEEAHPGLMGVRVDAPLTGRATDADDMHRAIDEEKIAAESPAAAAWIAMNGHEMTVPPVPPAIPLARFKRCYDNTLEFVQRNKGHKYCEGLVTDGRTGMAFQHAWAIDKAGNVVDPTMGWNPKAYYHGVTFPNTRVVKAARAKVGDLMAITHKSTSWLRKELKK